MTSYPSALLDPNTPTLDGFVAYLAKAGGASTCLAAQLVFEFSSDQSVLTATGGAQAALLANNASIQALLDHIQTYWHNGEPHSIPAVELVLPHPDQLH